MCLTKSRLGPSILQAPVSFVDNMFIHMNSIAGARRTRGDDITDYCGDDSDSISGDYCRNNDGIVIDDAY